MLPGEPLAGPMPQVFADAYLDDLEPPTFDLAKAKELIEASKYAGGDAIPKEIQRTLVDQQSDVYLLTQTSQQAFSECIDGFTWVPMQSFEFNFHTMKWVCE